MEHICHHRIGGLLANPLRRLIQDPARILAPYVEEGQLVLEPGPGYGFFTLELARRVGLRGRVVVLDVQEEMLRGLERRAERAGLLERIERRVVKADSLGVDDLEGRVDFALALWMVHEVPDPGRFFRELARALRPGGRLLFAEPRLHVGEAAFSRSLELGKSAGLVLVERPRIGVSRAAVLARPLAA